MEEKSLVDNKLNSGEEINDLKEENEKLIAMLNDIQYENAGLQYRIQSMTNSLSWRLTTPFRKTLDGLAKLVLKIKRVLDEIKKLFGLTIYTFKEEGLRVTLVKIIKEGYNNIKMAKHSIAVKEKSDDDRIWGELEKWIDETPHKFIDIFSVAMGWNTPLFQRFQHISLQVGKVGGISIYGAHPSIDKNIEVFKIVNPKLCIMNLDDHAIKRKLFEILNKKKGLKYIRIQSIDLATTMTEINRYLEQGYEIIYEYIDELTPQITGNIPEFVYRRHEAILKNENIIAVATSDKLYDQMKHYRNKNMAMINNGVDYEFWNIKKEETPCPEDIISIINEGKIVVGYHGALAKWIDYDLLKRIATDGRFTLLLIGHEHDECLKKSKLLEYENVYYIGAKPYHELNKYAIYYDVGILPFLINNITLSVSPVKIFEYMAQEKPVVTYALPECQKYSSCLCAETQDEFMEQLDKAIELKDNDIYIQQLKKDALSNTWLSITEQMIGLVYKFHMNKERLEKSSIEPIDISTVTKIVNYEASASYKENYINQILHIPDPPLSTQCVPITKEKFCRREGDVKIIAYYLTQFHPDAHNEKWWGRGTTEWNNVIRAVPQFVGHYQPRLPGELGCYDLRIKDNIVRQIELAKMYGIYGFSFYYYWFDGERLLEKPLEAFLENKDLNFPFSLCWANENWTRKYDGTNEGILMNQPKSLPSYQNVIADIARFLKDDRYIKIGDKKLLTVYRPSLMPNAQKIIEYWRKYCNDNGLGELYVIAVKENTVETNWLEQGFDALTEFHPGTVYQQCHNITEDLTYIRKDFGGEVFSYKDIVEHQKYFKYNYSKLYRAVMPMWDNTARRNNKGMIFQGSTPQLYKKWLKDVILEQRERDDLDDKLIFINAWNEWGEGTYLEPDKKFGYAYLQASKEAIEESRF